VALPSGTIVLSGSHFDACDANHLMFTLYYVQWLQQKEMIDWLKFKIIHSFIHPSIHSLFFFVFCFPPTLTMMHLCIMFNMYRTSLHSFIHLFVH